MLVCSVHEPDVFRDTFPPLSYQHSWPTSVQQSRPQPITSWPDTPLSHVTESVGLRFDEGKLSEWGWVGEDTGENSGNLCASDPVVQAEVAKLSLGEFAVPFSPFMLRTLRVETSMCLRAHERRVLPDEAYYFSPQ